MVAEVEVEVMGGARSRITEAFWFETFLLIAGQKNFVFRLRDSGLLGMCTFLRIITLENLEGLHLCNLWIPMMLQKRSTI